MSQAPRRRQTNSTPIAPPDDPAALAARHRAPSARCHDGGVRRLGDADRLPVRNDRGASRLPSSGGDVRRVAPRNGAGRGFRCVRAPATDPDQRPRTRSNLVVPSTRTSSTHTTRRSSTTSSCGGMPGPATCSTSCRTLRTRAGCGPRSAGSTPRTLEPSSPSRVPRRANLVDGGLPGGSSGRPVPRRHVFVERGLLCRRRHRLHRRGRYRDRGAERRTPGHSGGRWRPPGSPRPASVPATPCDWRRRFRCTATNSGRGSPRSRPGWDGSWRGTNRSSSAGTPRSPSANVGIDRRLVGIATEGRRPSRAELPVLAGRSPVGVVTSGNFSPGARSRHRAGVPAPGHRRRHSGHDRRPRQGTLRDRRPHPVRHPLTPRPHHER